MGSEDKGFPVGQISPLPGQKGIRLAKKRRWFLFCWMRASAVFSQAIPFPPRLFAEREEDGEGRLNPGRFCLRRLPYCPGNVKADPNHQLNGR